MTFKSVKELTLAIGLMIAFVFHRIWDFGSDVVSEWKSRKKEGL